MKKRRRIKTKSRKKNKKKGKLIIKSRKRDDRKNHAIMESKRRKKYRMTISYFIIGFKTYLLANSLFFLFIFVITSCS